MSSTKMHCHITIVGHGNATAIIHINHNYMQSLKSGANCK